MFRDKSGSYARTRYLLRIRSFCFSLAPGIGLDNPSSAAAAASKTRVRYGQPIRVGPSPCRLGRGCRVSELADFGEKKFVTVFIMKCTRGHVSCSRFVSVRWRRVTAGYLLKFLVFTVRIKSRSRLYFGRARPLPRCFRKTHNSPASVGAGFPAFPERCGGGGKGREGPSHVCAHTALCTYYIAGGRNDATNKGADPPQPCCWSVPIFPRAPKHRTVMSCAHFYSVRLLLFFFFLFVPTTGVARVFHPRATAQNTTPCPGLHLSSGRCRPGEGRFSHSPRTTSHAHCESQ